MIRPICPCRVARFKSQGMVGLSATSEAAGEAGWGGAAGQRARLPVRYASQKRCEAVGSRPSAARRAAGSGRSPKLRVPPRSAAGKASASSQPSTRQALVSAEPGARASIRRASAGMRSPARPTPRKQVRLPCPPPPPRSPCRRLAGLRARRVPPSGRFVHEAWTMSDSVARRPASTRMIASRRRAARNGDALKSRSRRAAAV